MSIQIDQGRINSLWQLLNCFLYAAAAIEKIAEHEAVDAQGLNIIAMVSSQQTTTVPLSLSSLPVQAIQAIQPNVYVCCPAAPLQT